MVIFVEVTENKCIIECHLRDLHVHSVCDSLWERSG